ncbi:hypothetical protein [Paenibacillus odorifer]|nr:hypothetical protein [Paenibacillus odorifer]
MSTKWGLDHLEDLPLFCLKSDRSYFLVVPLLAYSRGALTNAA